MSKNSATTRRSRRVVWLLALLSVIGIAFTWKVATIWFERDTVSQAAPDQTALMLRFTPTGKQWDLLDDLFGNASVVTNRSLTIRELQSMTEGEFAIFFGEDGSQSVAIHSSREHIPTNKLDAQGIVVQEISPNTYLLSDTLLPVSGLPERSPWFTWPVFGYTKIGTITVPDAGGSPLFGNIFASHGRLMLRTPKLPTDRIDKPITTDTIVAATVLPAKFSQMSKFFSPIDPALAALGLPTGTLIESLARQAGGTVIIGQDSEETGVLLSIPESVFPKSTAEDAIRGMAALEKPLLRAFQLPDRTSVEEIYVDPSSVSLEERTIAGSPVSRATTHLGEMLVASSNGQTILSTSEQLLSLWVTPSKASSNACDVSRMSTFIDLDRADNLLASDSDSIHISSYSILSRNFGRLIVKNTALSTQFLFCDECCG